MPGPTPQSALPSAPLGRSIVAGVAVGEGAGPVHAAEAKFYAIEPQSGRELSTLYLAASPDDVERAGWAAWGAFHALSGRPGAERAGLLETIADLIVGLGEGLIGLAADETGLGPARLVSERDRTVYTLRMFAEMAREGSWVEAVIDTGQPSRRPTPRPDLRRMLRPLGPVAVFGAGNFPLAYSTAGGDTASALAAGCPVIVKGHPGHPGTGELVAHCVARAVERCGLDPGTFSFLHAGGEREMGIGRQLVEHPAVRAVGFTGSLAGGKALSRAAAERSGGADPIPVFAEMGSTNPVFVLPGAAEAHAEEIAERVASSATASGGQMCTCPGLVFVARSPYAEDLARGLAERFNATPSSAMLSPRTRGLYAKRAAEVAGVSGVQLRAGSPNPGHSGPEGWEPGSPVLGAPALLRTSFEVFRRSPTLHEEVFGPACVVVVCESAEQLVDAAASVHGSLTGTIWAGAVDADLAVRVQSVLEQRVGRLIYNGVPTGVEVVSAMVHGGPFPATNQPWSTAVGTLAARRWCRPVCYQNTPEGFLPAELRNANPRGIRRVVNGVWEERR